MDSKRTINIEVTATARRRRPAFAPFLPLFSPIFLVVMGIRASLPSSPGASLPLWWQLSSGVIWGTLLCLLVLLVAQAVADTIPDSLSGLYTVSQVMVSPGPPGALRVNPVLYR